jgi:hypothetical protein
LEEKTVTIFDALFGCWHKRMSFPITSKRGQRRPEAAMQTGTYTVCLDCGKEFAYDWQNMKVQELRPVESGTRAHVEAKAS